MEMKDIEQRIAKEQNEFNLEKFEGKLPANLIELFKRAFMTISVDRHKMPPAIVKAITDKKVSELTNLDVRQLFNVIILAEPQNLWKDYDAAIKGLKVISDTMIDCNIALSKKQREWDATKANLIKLSGIDVNGRKPALYQA